MTSAATQRGGPECELGQDDVEHGLIRLPLLYIDLISPLVHLILLPCHISYVLNCYHFSGECGWL